MKEAVVCVTTIFIRTFGLQLLAKNSNVKKPDTNKSDWYTVSIKRWDNHRSSVA